MATEAQNLSREMILRAYKAPLHLSRLLYKSTLFMQNKANLPDAQMKVSSVLTKDYENDNTFRLPENKPKQTQFPPAPPPKTPATGRPKRQIISNIKSGRVNLQPSSRLSAPVSLVVVSARSPLAEKLTGKKLIILSIDSILSAV